MTGIRQLLVDFADGSRSPVEVTVAALAAIDRDNPLYNALPTLAPRDRVLADAERLTTALRHGEPVGALAGLPYAAKDTHRTAGLRTTWGSPIHAQHVPDSNDPVVQRLLDADTILLGKSNTPEFAAGSQTFNPLFGITRNPYALDRTVGGSSGGAACAIATGMTVVADGSDLAASLRNPASFCGVTGLRPSTRVDPLIRNGENLFGSLNMFGPLARSVDDARLVWRAIDRPAPRMPIRAHADALLRESADSARGARDGRLPRATRGMRIAWTEDAQGRMPVSVPVRRAMRRAAHLLNEAGIEMIEACPDFSGADECFQTLRGLYFVENLGALYATERERMKDTVVWNIEFGLDLDAARIAAAGVTRSRVFERCANFLSDIDAWLLPTAQVLPFAAHLPYPADIQGETPGTYIDWLRSCYWITVSGHPAISIPAGFEADEDGRRLPFGLQIVGRYGQDEAMLDVAETLESLLAPLNAQAPVFER